MKVKLAANAHIIGNSVSGERYRTTMVLLFFLEMSQADMIIIHVTVHFVEMILHTCICSSLQKLLRVKTDGNDARGKP